jgi:SAM-dependent methyltransferase
MEEIDGILAPIVKEPWLKKKWIKATEFINSSRSYSKYMQMLFDIIDLRKGIKILDVGCGCGIEIIEFANLGADCVGLEIVEAYAKAITAIGKKFSIEVRGDLGDGCDLPYENESFDVVMSKNYFEHLKNFDLGMKEQIRVLKEGGQLIVIDGNLLCPTSLINLLFIYPLRTRGKHGGLKWLFTKNRVRKKLYELDWTGKDEDTRSIFWWKKKMMEYDELRIIDITTTKAYQERRKVHSHFLKPFLGDVVVIGLKI